MESVAYAKENKKEKKNKMNVYDIPDFPERAFKLEGIQQENH
jgi:hypothetical protein